MSAVTVVAGHPVHAVIRFSRRTTPHGVVITSWTGLCGATGTDVGSQPFRLAGSARRLELCRACFPFRGWEPARYIDEPVEVPPRCPGSTVGDHTWPSEMDASSSCERCGMPYAEAGC
jgi:hypothetical protein